MTRRSIIPAVAIALVVVVVALTLPSFMRDVDKLGEPERKIQQELGDLQKKVGEFNDQSQQVQKLQQEVERLKKLIPPDPGHSILDDAQAKLKKGMTEDEALAAVKSCGVDWNPEYDRSYEYDDPLTKSKIRCRDMTWGSYIIGVGPDTPTATDYPNQHDYKLELGLSFADGKLYEVDRMDWYKTRWNMKFLPREALKDK